MKLNGCNVVQTYHIEKKAFVNEILHTAGRVETCILFYLNESPLSFPSSLFVTSHKEERRNEITRTAFGVNKTAAILSITIITSKSNLQHPDDHEVQVNGMQV